MLNQPVVETPKSNEKTEGEKPAEAEKPKEAAKPEGAPEKYEDFKAPEGFEFDKATVEKAVPLFKELGLSQAQAQKLVDFQAQNSIDNSQAALQAVKDMRNGWVKQVRESPEFKSEFGADGKLKPDSKILVGVGRMLDSIGDAKLANDFRTAMDLTGAGDHPAFIRVMTQLAERLGEGTAVRGNNPSPHGQNKPGTGDRRSPAQEMYPKLPSAMGT